MRKVWPFILGIGLVAAAVAVAALAINSSNNHDDNASSNTSKTKQTPKSTVKNACDIFTLADAKTLLGGTAKGGEIITPTTTDDLIVSSCTYTQDKGSNTPTSSSNSATLLVRAPKTSKGAQSNINQFGPLRPTDADDVSGYGDSAYWDAEHGQLNILENNTWYILSKGPNTPAERNLEDTKKLADLIMNKL